METTIDDLRLGSETRLWALIEERTRSGADQDAIDSKIWELFGEEWAVMFTDLTGFSRHTERFGITHFLQVIHESKKILFPVIAEHNGFLVKSEADSLLLVFRSPTSALRCALAMQRACHRENVRRVAEEEILLCIGLGFGRILRIGDHDVWGKEVNAASKLGEDTAKSYEILVTDAVRRAAEPGVELEYQPLEHEIPGSKTNYRLHYKLS